MKIYLDFDDTILNTDGFVKELIRIFSGAGFTAEDFYDNYEKTKEKVGDFDLDTIFNLFVAQKEFDARRIRRSVDNIFSNIDVFVYGDFFDFVKEFPKEELAMLSYGTTSCQRDKIENAKIVPYFSELVVTPRSKEESFPDILRAHPEEEIFFVEDKADQIDRVKLVAPFITAMKMERPEGRHTHGRSQAADYVVHDFHEVADIIKKKRKMG